MTNDYATTVRISRETAEILRELSLISEYVLWRKYLRG